MTFSSRMSVPMVMLALLGTGLATTTCQQQNDPGLPGSSASASASSPASAPSSEESASVEVKRGAIVATPTCGTANDTSVIQTALNTADEVILPASATCNVTTLSIGRPNQWLHGRGPSTILKMIAGFGAGASLVAVQQPNAVISDMTLDGSMSAGGNSNIGVNAGTSSSGMSLTGLSLRNIGTGAYVVESSGAPNAANIKNVLISNNLFNVLTTAVDVRGHNYTDGSGVAQMSVGGVVVSTNVITTAGAGLFVRGVKGITTSDNTIEGGAGAGINLESGVYNAVLSGNVIHGFHTASNGAAAIQLGLGGLSLGYGISITSNVIYESDSGVAVYNMSTDRFRQLIISDNIVADTVNGIVVTDAADVSIERNQLRNAASIGLWLTSRGNPICSECTGLDRVTVHGNLFRAKPGATSTGMRIDSSDFSDAVITTNNFKSEGAPAGYTPVVVTSTFAGASEFANNLGWTGGSSGLHSGRNVAGQLNFTCPSGSCTQPVVTFPVVEPDTNYRVMLTPVAVSTGAALGATHVRTVAKQAAANGTSAGFTVTLESALTAGQNVKFDWIVLRNP